MHGLRRTAGSCLVQFNELQSELSHAWSACAPAGSCLVQFNYSQQEYTHAWSACAPAGSCLVQFNNSQRDCTQACLCMRTCRWVPSAVHSSTSWGLLVHDVHTMTNSIAKTKAEPTWCAVVGQTGWTPVGPPCCLEWSTVMWTAVQPTCCAVGCISGY